MKYISSFKLILPQAFSILMEIEFSLECLNNPNSDACNIFKLLIISSPLLPHSRKNKHTHMLDDLFWVGFWKGRGYQEKKVTKKQKHNKNSKKKGFGRPTLGWGRGEGSPMHCFLFCFFLQIADSRWLTWQWNSQCNRKKGRPWGGRVSYMLYPLYIDMIYVYTHYKVYSIYVLK